MLESKKMNSLFAHRWFAACRNVGRAVMPAAAFQAARSSQAGLVELSDPPISAHNTGSVIDTMPSPYRGSPFEASS